MFKAEELRLVQEAAHLAIWEWVAETDELRWQPGSVELFGRPTAELTTGESFFECVAADDREKVRRCLLDSLTSRVDYSVEFRVALPGGELRWLVSNGRLVQDRGSGQIVVGVTRDITETKRRETQLRAQARLLDLAYEPILVRDSQDRIAYWNKGAERLYGYTRQEAKGKRSHDLLRTEFGQPLAEIEKELRSSGLWQGELVHCTKNGRYIHVASRWQRISNGEDHVLETNFDLSQQKALEVAKAWQQKAKLIGEFAHEINNPLEAATGVAHILKGSCDERSQQYVDVLEKSIKRIAEFIKRSNELHNSLRFAKELDDQESVQ